MNNSISLGEIIIRGRYLFSKSPSCLSTFNEVDGKSTSDEIANRTDRHVNAINRDLRSLKNFGLINESKKDGRKIIYEKNPIAGEISQSDFVGKKPIPSTRNPEFISTIKKTEIPSVLKIPDEIEILEIARSGESQIHEFKEDRTQIKKIVREIAAMANTSQGGIIFYGVDDDGGIQGTTSKAQDLDQPLQNSVKDLITPSLIVQLSQVSIMGTPIILIIVPPKPTGLVYLLNGATLIRKGTNVFHAKADELKKLISK